MSVLFRCSLACRPTASRAQKLMDCPEVPACQVHVANFAFLAACCLLVQCFVTYVLVAPWPEGAGLRFEFGGTNKSPLDRGLGGSKTLNAKP